MALGPLIGRAMIGADFGGETAKSAVPDEFKFDFFVSRRGQAANAGQEICNVLAAAGHSVRIQDKDIGPGDNFVAWMDEMLTQCQHFIAVLSRDYIQSKYTRREWTNFLAASEASNGARRLIPFRVEDVEPTGLLAGTVYADLVGVVDPAARRDIILGAVLTRAGAREAHQALPRLQSAGATATTFHGVPPRNGDFCGRSKFLAKLQRRFNTKGRSNATRVVAIHGLGGIGKSSTAIEYAHDTTEKYAGIWWAEASSRAILIGSLAELFDVLDRGQSTANIYSYGDRPDRERLAKAALAKLTQSPLPWLLIYDNVPNEEDVHDLIPSRGAHLLVTTRSPWKGRAVPLELDVLEEFEATRLLLRLTGRKDGPGAVRLSKTLGYLPLALEQASAHIAETGMPFSRYADRADELIAGTPRKAKYPGTVAATFGIGIERAVAECAAADKLLDLLSVLAPELIPRDLIDGAIPDEDDRNGALSALRRSSLIKYDDTESEIQGSAVSVHRLVQAAMQQRLRAAGRLVPALHSTIDRIAAAYPDKSYSDPTCWPRCKQLLPHALALRREAQAARIATHQLALLLNGAANYLLGGNAFGDAETLFRECIEMAIHVLGRDHADVGRWLNDFGNLYLNSGRFEEAKKKYREAVSIGVKTLGRNHPGVATRINNWAYALMRTGEARKAEAYYLEAIKISVKAFGRNSKVVAARLNNLGNLYRETRRFGEAEINICEAISIGELISGRDDPAVSEWIAGLANLLRDAGRCDEAEPLYYEALDSLTRSVGPKHSRVNFTLENLAELHLLMGRLDKAYAEATQALDGHKATFGAHHRWTRGAAEVLSKVLVALGRLSEAAETRSEYGTEREVRAG